MAQSFITTDLGGAKGQASDIPSIDVGGGDLDKIQGLDFGKINLELTEEQKKLPNPFDNFPEANPKSFLETSIESVKLGQADMDVSFDTYDLWRKNFESNVEPTKQELDEIERKREDIERRDYFNQPANFASGMLHGGERMIPGIVGAQTQGLAYGATGAAALGGGTALLTAPLSPFVELPAAGTAALAGFKYGNLIGQFEYWRKQGTGDSYYELIRNGVNPTTASNIAGVVGPLYSAIQYLQTAKILDTVAGKKLKGGILRGSMYALAKRLPGKNTIARQVAAATLRASETSIGRGAIEVVDQSIEEGVQKVITETGLKIGESEQELIKQGGEYGALDVLSNLDLGDAKDVVSSAITEFGQSIGPMAGLVGYSKLLGGGARVAKNFSRKIAGGELDKLSDTREKLVKAGAPKTAEALAAVELTAPTIKPEDTVGLEEDLEAAGVPIASTAAPVPTPVATTPEAEPTPIRAPKSITKPMRTTLKDMGYSDEAIDKLAPQDALDVIAGGEAAMVPPTPAVTPAVEPEKEKAAEAPTAEATAAVSTGVQPKAPKEGAAPVVPTLEQPEARPNILARNWLTEVDQAKNKRERQDLIDIFRGKIDSLSEDERLAAKIFDSEIVRRAEQPKVEAVAPTTPVPAPTAEAPKMQAPPALPKWEDVLKNQRQIRFLRKVFKDANAQLPKDRQITPKAGWKGQDFFKALENIYGQLTQLEFAKPELKPPTPGVAEPISKAEEKRRKELLKKVSEADRRKSKIRGMVKVFSNLNLNGDQIYFRDLALNLASSISKQVGAEFPNLVNAADEIYTRLIDRIAGRLYSSVNLNRPILFNKEGQPTDLTEENISKYVMFSARRAALDALEVQKARAEVAAEFGTAPAEGAVTQPEAAREEAAPAGMQVAEAPTAPVAESRAVTSLREAAKILRDQSGPEVKLVIDWIVDTMVGADTELGKLKTYKELADYLSKVAGRKISDKRVGEVVNKAVEQIAQNLREDGIAVSVESLEMLLTPEGRAARERKATEEAERKQAREIRQAIANLSDRARNLKIGMGARQALIDAISVANTATRARITSEIIVPLEEGLIGENDVAQRLDNIQKGIENAKPRVRQAVPRRGRGAAQQVEEGPVRGRTGEGVEGERGRPSAGAVAEGQPQAPAGGVEPVGARPSGVGREVGKEQPKAPSVVSVDPRLTGKNQPPVIRAFVETVTSSGQPANYVLDPTISKPLTISQEESGGDEDVPTIYVNPRLLGQMARILKTKAKFDEWAYLAINEEIVHFKHLKTIKAEAKELGISFKQHLKNETKRIVSIIKKRRGLKKRLELIYNDGKAFTGELGDSRMALEWMRMIIQKHMTGKFTELTWLAGNTDFENIIRALEAQERRFIFRFIDNIRQFLYGITGRTAAETRFLRQTADTVSQMAQRVSRSIARPNEAKPVSMNYYKPKEDSLAKTTPRKGEQAKAREELRKESGLSRANVKFLAEYAKELGIKVPTTKRKVTVFNEKTRKHEEKIFRVPFWKKADYVTAIQEKLAEINKKQKEIRDEDMLGTSLPTDRPYWLKPDGEIVDVEENALIDLMSIGSHAESAVGWMEENEPEAQFLTEWKLLDPLDRKERQQLPVTEMLRKGWLRVVGDAFTLYFEGNPNQTQMDKLFEAAINDEVKLVQDLSGLSGRPRSKTIYEPPLEDEIGVAMPRRGFSTTLPKLSSDWEPLPDSLDELEEIERRAGTFDVRVYMNETGLRYVVKRGQSREQFENEIAAENIYRLLNYPVPNSKLITLPNGEVAKISDYIAGPTLRQFVEKMKDSNPEIVQKVFDDIGDGLLVDTFLFNYDVIGAGMDNIIVAHEEIFDQDVITSGSPSVVYYAPYRVDNGGTFDTRATGLKREEPFFYDTFKKLEDMYPQISLRTSEMVAQIADLVLNSDEILNSVPERLRPMMSQRLQWMADQFSALDTMPASIGNSDEDIFNHFEKLSKEMALVKVVRDAQGRLINEKTGLPSEIKVYDNRGKVVKVIPKSEFRYRLERTSSFKMWFGDWENFPEGKGTSKVLDESGEPAVMYHGTSWSKRQLGYVLPQNRDNGEFESRFWPIRAFTTANAFRGGWFSTSRQFAENWANSNTYGEYDEQIVIPMYIKSTNPFDPRNPAHVEKLIAYGKTKGSGFSLNLQRRVALEKGWFDWTVFEGTELGQEIPTTGGAYDDLTEEERKRRYFQKYPYTTLEAIVNLGFDSVWARERSDGKAETFPRDYTFDIVVARSTNDKAKEAEAEKNLENAVKDYDNNSVWNLLLFRPDGAKSILNSGKFKTQEQIKNFKPTNEASAKAGRVTRNQTTLWNEFVKDGVTYASYDNPERLVTYAYMTTNELSKNNIAKDVIRDGLVYVGERTAPGVKSYKQRNPADLLGTAMPRRFGVRLKDKVSEDAYAKLKNLAYSPIPDSMTEAEADDYLAKNGVRGSIDAALSDVSPLQHGSRELLAQKIILAMNALYEKDKDPRILDDMLMFIDRFLEQTSGIGRALRALSFWSNLTPEGMLMLYKKKMDETNREVRDRFNSFFDKVKRELSVLPEGAVDETLKKMSKLLEKAQAAADESKKKLAENNMMTFWEQFSKQMGDSIAEKAAQQLAEAEAAAAQAQGIPVDQLSPEQRKALKKLENTKSINQAAQQMSGEIKRMFMALAQEQGRSIRDPRINTDEEFANKTIDEQEKLRKEERESLQKKNFTAMLARWPKALQAWKIASDEIRAKIATNPELSEMFNGFLGLVLESPFTMPQLKRFISLRGVKLEDLIRKHYEEGKLANNAYSLAKELVDEAGLGAWEEEIGADEKGAEGLFKFKREEDMRKEEPAIREKTLSLSERLTNAIALQIQEIVAKESEKKLNRLLKSYADKTLEPSLRRFAKRLVEYQALGLFNNAFAWNEFQRQEGLDKLKPDVVEKLQKIMVESQKLVGYRRDEKISDAISLIAFETQANIYNFAKSWWYVSILSGIATQFANFLGNMANTALLTIPTIAKHLVKGYSTDPKRSKAIIGSMFRALQLSFMDAGNILMTGRLGTRKEEPKFFGKGTVDIFEVVARNATKNTVKEKVGRVAATTASILRRVMSAVDMTFYNFNKEVYLFDAAYAKAEDEGLRGQEATAKALDYTFRNSQALSAAVALAESQGYVVDSENLKTRFLQKAERAIRVQEIIDENNQANNPELAAVGQIYGTELTYNEEPRGVLGAFHRMIGAFAKEHPLKSAVFVPFTRIVANVWNQSIDFTGWGIMRARGLPKALGPKLAGKFAMDFKGTAEEIKIQKDLAFTRGVTGLLSVFTIGFLDEILCGNYEKYGIELCINGSGPKETAQKELLKNRLGWKPNSIFIRVNHVPFLKDGVYASYMFSPLAMGLSAKGLFNDNETYNYFNEKEPADVALAVAHRVATIMFEMNFLSGLSDLFEMLNPSEPERALAKAKSFLSRFGSALVIPNFVRDVDQLIVSPIAGYHRTAREGPVQGAFIANTPIVRQLYGNEELDMLGKPVDMQFRPMSLADKDALVEMLVRKNALPSVPKKDSFFGVVKMTDEQFADYRAERAKQLGADLGQPGVIDILGQMTPEMAQLYVAKMAQKANAVAKAKILMENPKILEEVKTEKLKGMR